MKASQDLPGPAKASQTPQTWATGPPRMGPGSTMIPELPKARPINKNNNSINNDNNFVILMQTPWYSESIPFLPPPLLRLKVHSSQGGVVAAHLRPDL